MCLVSSDCRLFSGEAVVSFFELSKNALVDGRYQYFASTPIPDINPHLYKWTALKRNFSYESCDSDAWVVIPLQTHANNVWQTNVVTLLDKSFIKCCDDRTFATPYRS